MITKIKTHRFSLIKTHTLLRTLTAVSIVMISPAYAAHQKAMNDMKVIPVPVSREGLTRIAVKDDRIAHIFGLSNEFLLEADENQGQVFIRPQGRGIQNPISLTITTEAGYTQDLRLVPADQTPEAVILVHAKTPPSQEKVRSTITREEVKELMASCREGCIPNGYTQRPVDLKEQTGPHIILREIQGDTLIAQTLEVMNPTGQMLYLNPQDYGTAPGVIAVSLSKKALKPQEKGEVYVIREVL